MWAVGSSEWIQLQRLSAQKNVVGSDLPHVHLHSVHFINNKQKQTGTSVLSFGHRRIRGILTANMVWNCSLYLEVSH